ncbi:MAG: hypothetical protein ACRDHL_01895 [Candidatus Promineifilaceae bacterium]
MGLGLVALALLAGPFSMGLMMARRTNQRAPSGNSHLMTECCAPAESDLSTEVDSPVERLAALRKRRTTLERELAEWQADPGLARTTLQEPREDRP